MKMIKVLLSMLMMGIIIVNNAYSTTNSEVHKILKKEIEYEKGSSYYAVKLQLVSSKSKTGVIQKSRDYYGNWKYYLPFESNIKVKCIGRISKKVLKTYEDKINGEIYRDNMGRFNASGILTRGCEEVNYGCARGNCTNGFGSKVVKKDETEDEVLTGRFKDGKILYGFKKTEKSQNVYERDNPIDLEGFFNETEEEVNIKEVLKNLLKQKIIDENQMDVAIERLSYEEQDSSLGK